MNASCCSLMMEEVPEMPRMSDGDSKDIVSPTSSDQNFYRPIAPCDFAMSPSFEDSEWKEDECLVQAGKRQKTTANNESYSSPLSLFAPTLDNPNEQAALNTKDVFFDLNPRWRRAYMQEMSRNNKDGHSCPASQVILCPDDTCTPADDLWVEQPHQQPTSSPSRRTTTQRFLRSVDSPTDVQQFHTNGPVYFWHRANAFVADEGKKDEAQVVVPMTPKSSPVPAKESPPVSSGSSESSISASRPTKNVERDGTGLFLDFQRNLPEDATMSEDSNTTKSRRWSLQSLRQSLAARRRYAGRAQHSGTNVLVNHHDTEEDERQQHDSPFAPTTESVIMPVHWMERVDSMEMDLAVQLCL